MPQEGCVAYSCFKRLFESVGFSRFQPLMSIDAKTNRAAAEVTSPYLASDDTATRVLNAAGLIFAEKGYKNATVREICRAARVNLASVNYHFRDKERLYIETVKRAAQLRVEQAPMPLCRQGRRPRSSCAISCIRS